VTGRRGIEGDGGAARVDREGRTVLRSRAEVRAFYFDAYAEASRVTLASKGDTVPSGFVTVTGSAAHQRTRRLRPTPSPNRRPPE
jgi:hypothetical protein